MAQYLCTRVEAYWFSVTSFSKWLPGGHVMFFFWFLDSRRLGLGSITQVCFGISVSNFMCISFVAVDKSRMIFSYITFKMAALWFVAMFNCNPPIAPCYPLLWDGGILVDRWSTISSLTHWGRATHICVGKLTTIGSDKGLSPGRRQAIIWTIAGILLTGTLGTNFSEILIEIQTSSFKKMYLKMSSVKWRPFVSASMCYTTVFFALVTSQLQYNQ